MASKFYIRIEYVGFRDKKGKKLYSIANDGMEVSAFSREELLIRVNEILKEHARQ